MLWDFKISYIYLNSHVDYNWKKDNQILNGHIIALGDYSVLTVKILKIYIRNKIMQQ
jgi:hypothetical protein